MDYHGLACIMSDFGIKILLHENNSESRICNIDQDNFLEGLTETKRERNIELASPGGRVVYLTDGNGP